MEVASAEVSSTSMEAFADNVWKRLDFFVFVEASIDSTEASVGGSMAFVESFMEAVEAFMETV